MEALKSWAAAIGGALAAIALLAGVIMAQDFSEPRSNDSVVVPKELP